jgi:hypothetical protein
MASFDDFKLPKCPLMIGKGSHQCNRFATAAAVISLDLFVTLPDNTKSVIFALFQFPFCSR